MKYGLNDLYLTIQGEGLQAGLPMVLVRLQGCTVGCPWCDTRESWSLPTAAQMVDSGEIVARVQAAAQGATWVLLTGGEPGEQLCRELLDLFHMAGFSVACETSGTVASLAALPWNWLTVSPKIGMPGGLAISPEVCAAADEIKMVVGRQSDIDKLNTLLASLEVVPQVCLQPLSESKDATALCIQTCLQTGWRLSVQQHKLLGLR